MTSLESNQGEEAKQDKKPLQVSLAGNPNGRQAYLPRVCGLDTCLIWVVQTWPAHLAGPDEQLGKKSPGLDPCQSPPSQMRFVPLLNGFGTCRNLQFSSFL